MKNLVWFTEVLAIAACVAAGVMLVFSGKSSEGVLWLILAKMYSRSVA